MIDALRDPTTDQAALIVAIVAAAFALYASVIGHRTLRWQKARDREQRAVSTRIEVGQQMVIDAPPGGGGVEHLRVRFRVTISAINESETTVVYIRSLMITNKTSGLVLLTEDEDDVRLEPRQRVSREVFLGNRDVERFKDGIEARAVLSTGEAVVLNEPLDSTVIESYAAAHQQLLGGSNKLTLHGSVPDPMAQDD